MIKIILYKGDFWFAKLVKYFTGSNYYHAALLIDGVIYESTAYFDSKGYWHNGVQKRIYHGGGDEYIFKQSIEDKKQQLIDFINKHMEGEPYNFPKLIAMAFIYPTRWFWKLIGYVPFSQSIYGYICSVFVDRAFKAIGIDLLPDEREGYTSPGDLAKSKLLRRET